MDRIAEKEIGRLRHENAALKDKPRRSLIIVDAQFRTVNSAVATGANTQPTITSVTLSPTDVYTDDTSGPRPARWKERTRPRSRER